MKELKTAFIMCGSLVFLGVTSAAIYTVRAFLPFVGLLLLCAIVVGIVGALLLGVLHLHSRFTRYEHTAISQYGSVLTRRNELIEFAPYYPASQGRLEGPTSAIVDAEEDTAIIALLPEMKSFSELLDAGIIQAALDGGKMVLGYYASTHELRYGSWLDLYSCGNGGASGTGKSTTTRFLLFQAVLAGARLIMIDPHIGDEDESLAFQFSQLPTSIHQIKPANGSDANVEKRVEWLNKEMARRKRQGAKTPFIVFVIDEFNSVMRHATKEIRGVLAKLLLDIEQEGRKFGIFAMLIGQRWSAQDLGGADIRSSLSSKMGHRFSDEDQAIRFLGSKWGKSLLELEQGHWFFYDTQGKTQEMVTPETWASDGAKIAALMRDLDESTTETAVKSREITPFFAERTTDGLAFVDESETESETESANESTSESTAMLELARRIMTLQASGMQKADIMRHIWHVNPGGTQAYQQAQEEYQLVLAFIASQIGA